MKSGLGKGILVVLAANIVNLLFNLLTNLIVPKHLSIDSYAAIKTYQLYMSYIGIVHLGYIDGLYLKYGGKDIYLLDKKRVAKEISVLRCYLIVAMIIGVGIAIILKKDILMMVLLAMLPTNLLSCFQFLYQACGEFKAYGKILNFVAIGTFIINIFLIYGLKTDDYILYLLGYVSINIVLWIFTEVKFSSLAGNPIVFFYFSFEKLIKGMKDGILLTLGNFSSVIMTTMDRWFVSIMIGNVAFAQYAFAVSMENFLNTAITPITVTLYNYFCNHDEENRNAIMKRRVIAFGSVIIAAAFPVKFILETYLDKYFDSYKVLFILFASQLFYVIIKGIYVNLYKARRNQKKYFTDLVQVLLIGFVLDFIGGHVFQTKEVFAYATLISSVIWFVKCGKYFSDIRISEIVYLAFQVVAFLALGFYCSAIFGCIAYIFITAISLHCFLPEVVVWAKNIVRLYMEKSLERRSNN